MRKGLSVALIAGLLCVVGEAREAGATVTIALEWGECGGGTGGCTATGSNTIDVNPGGGQTLRLDIFMSHDLAQGLAAHLFSLNFDTDLDNELNLGPMASVEWNGTDTDPNPLFFNLYGPYISVGVSTLESGGASAGRINSFESATIDSSKPLPPNGAAYSVGTFTGTAPARYRVGQAYFTVNFSDADGSDVFAGLFNGAFDTFIDGDDAVVPTGSIIFGTAILGLFVPEPGTVSLLGLGLAGLALAYRRRRRF